MSRKDVLRLWCDMWDKEDSPDYRKEEWTKERLMAEMPLLTEEDVGDLEIALGKGLKYDMYNVPKEKAGSVLEMIQESLHQGMDGFSREEQFVINMFLNDIAFAVSLEGDNA